MESLYEVFLKSAPEYLPGIFFGDANKYERSMRWLYDVFGGWPGRHEITYLYDGIKILIAASVLSACCEDGKQNDRIKDMFERYDRFENMGTPQALADVAAKFGGIDPISYVTAEDFLIERFDMVVHPIDFKLTSSDWIGDYGFGGLKPLHRMEDRQPLQTRYNRYFPIVRGMKVVPAEDVVRCTQFITIADDASNCSIFEMMDQKEKRDVLLCAYHLTERLFNVGLARSIGASVIHMLSCNEPGSMVDKWKQPMPYYTHMDVESVENMLEDFGD